MTLTMFPFYFSRFLLSFSFSLVFHCYDMIRCFQKLNTVLDHIPKRLEACQKYSVTHHVFSVFLGVWKCGEARSFVFKYSFINSYN